MGKTQPNTKSKKSMVISNTTSSTNETSVTHLIIRNGTLKKRRTSNRRPVVKGNGCQSPNGTTLTSLQPTSLYLPTRRRIVGEDLEPCKRDVEMEGFQQQSVLYMPKSTQPIDEYFKTIPEIMESCDGLLTKSVRHFTCSSKERLVYITQREVGHAVPSQCDILVTDRATTCHMLAFRSVSGDVGSIPLSSLAHIDSPCYDHCVRAMVDEHIAHHHQTFKNQGLVCEEVFPRICLDVHIVGGFDDEKNESHRISTWLMELLIRLADEVKDRMTMILRTCIISSMNDNGFRCPIARGLGIDVQTGMVFRAAVDRDVMGPFIDLRSARLWSSKWSSSLSSSSSSSPSTCTYWRRGNLPLSLSSSQPPPRPSSLQRYLAIIHTSHRPSSSPSPSHNPAVLTIDPFFYQPFGALEWYVSLPDPLLLQCCSTSPSVEEPDFCDSVRSTFYFIRDVDCRDVFGRHIQEPLICHRMGSSNYWTTQQDRQGNETKRNQAMEA